MVVASLRGDCWDRNRISLGSILKGDIVVTSATDFRVFLHGQDGTVYCGRRTDVSIALDQGLKRSTAGLLLIPGGVGVDAGMG